MPLSLSHADLTTGDEPRYEAVAAQYQTAGYQPVQGVRIRVAGGEYTSRAPDGQLQVVKDFQGRPGSTLLWSENVPWVEWTFSVSKAGLYSLELTYQQVPGKGASIQRGLQINGRYPFEEAKRLDLYRVWKDAHPPIPDADGNDVRAPQVEVPTWQTVDLNDGDGWYSQPFEFYFTPGPQRIRLLTIREPIAIGSLALVSPVDPPTYQNVLTEYKQRGYRPAPTGTIINLQAERPTAKADPTIRSEVSYDPLTEPPANGKRILNQLGGFRWRHGGEWVEWTINVPADGLYQLGFRELQGSTTALPVARTIAIDGRVPFREFWEVWFPYDSQWQFFRPHQANGQPYLLYLTKGQHTIRLTPVLGELRDVIWSVDDAQQAMADLLRQVMLITGPQPDPNRVWDLTTQIPDLVPRLQKMADDLDQQSQTLAQLAGYWPNAANSLRQVAEELRSLARDPDSMPGRLNDFDASETTLGNWSLNLTDAPLALDYIWLAAPDAVPPRATANLFERGVAAFQNFLASFKANYDSVGTTYGTGTGSGPVLTVWVGRGREWGEIMKDMIEEDFTPRTGIKVNLQVFPPGQLDAGGLNVLLLAASSGQAPDVATGVEPNLPVEFAMRGSIVDISQFPDYPEVAGWFRPGAIIPFEYQGKVYALPETQDFMMLFYRTDILNALHLKPPQTWQDVYDMIWILQQNGMDFYFPPVGQGRPGVDEANPGGFTPFLFQDGGSYYTPDGLRSALNTPQALAAFKEWTGLYTNYKIPLQANFFNRMRTGEMPIGVANYWTYVLLSTAAPELAGRWAMAPMPGHRLPNGQIDRATGGQGSAVVMFTSTKLKQQAWEFMKWWMSADTQVRFGNELEALLGVEARWNTANVEALNRLPWPQQDIKAIQEQWQWFQEAPVVPGGYFTGRHIVNAWNRVVLDGENPREALDLAVRDIDRELRAKQEEFGIRASN